MNSRQLRRYNHRKRTVARSFARIQRRFGIPISGIWGLLSKLSDEPSLDPRYNWWAPEAKPTEIRGATTNLVIGSDGDTFAEKSK